MGVCSVAHPMKRPFHPLSRLNWDSEVLVFVEEVTLEKHEEKPFEQGKLNHYPLMTLGIQG